MEIQYSSSFLRAYKKCPDWVKMEAKRKENIFRANPSNPGLKVHKLKGKLTGYLSFSVSYSY